MENKFRGKVTDAVAKLLNFGDDSQVEGYYYKDLCGGVLKSFITDGAHIFEVFEDTVAKVIFDCGAFSLKADDYWPALYDILEYKGCGQCI